MDIQTIIVFLIVFAAATYAGRMFWRKAKSFSAKSACGDGADCGCGSETGGKSKNALTQIKRRV